MAGAKDRVDEREVRKLAQLAHLSLSDAEIREAAGHLDALLQYVARIASIDVSGASETIHVGERATPLRPDVVVPGLPREVVTAGAPSAPAGLFEVPKVVDRTGERGVSTTGEEDDADR
jgi:aspartyl-tRNA(Asn)/glutamyl-tRNA(Gln) amidotransferase subunit C